jgi:D-glycero-beta-D-manno-heptose-7-phosphate kinase
VIISKNRCNEIFDIIKNKKIAVIGDLMLDEYLIGHVNRISPEAPVPVVDVKEVTLKLGGAANVCLNLSSLGASVMPFGVSGDDKESESLFSILKQSSIETNGILKLPNRRTTVKTRIIGEHQQICRVDREDSFDLSENETKRLISMLEANINGIDAVIIEDYNKGVITKELIESVIEICNKKNIPTFIDPKFSNFFEYKFVTVFKPNLREISTALSLRLENMNDYKYAAKELKKKLSAKNILITLSEEGMLILNENDQYLHVPTKALEVSDVSGAGDTVIATLAAVYISGASLEEAMIMANDAAGIVVSELGIVPIKREELMELYK